MEFESTAPEPKFNHHKFLRVLFTSSSAVFKLSYSHKTWAKIGSFYKQKNIVEGNICCGTAQYPQESINHFLWKKKKKHYPVVKSSSTLELFISG